MLNHEHRQMILLLHKNGESTRAIAKLLKISRNTVKKVLTRRDTDLPQLKMQQNTSELTPIIRELFIRCKGNVIRIQEILKDEYNKPVAYSTLTRLVREHELRNPPKRAGTYYFEPGQEMQHDTSPHKIKIGAKVVKAQCASLVLAYSRKLYMQYYPCFTRFEAKSFLKSALEFMGCSAKRCVIDNTSVILAAGSGVDAVITPEMVTFGRMFGFEFIAHSVGHADRKARVERPFHYIENNFLAGRIFNDWADLNKQAINWCDNVSNKKEKRSLGMTPEAAFIQEKSYLTPLPAIMPPVYEHYQRIVDSNGCINIDTNGYSVPEKLIGKKLEVYKYSNEIKIIYKHKEIAKHQRIIGKRYARAVIKGHHAKLHSKYTRTIPSESEIQLRGQEDILDDFMTGLKRHIRGRGIRQFDRLLNLKRTYPQDAFIAAIKQAQQYGLYDLTRLEELIIKYVAGYYFNLVED